MSALSTTATHEYYSELGYSLPPPVLDEPEHRERRLAAAVETFEALRPGDAYEARLAVRIVVCGAHAIDSLRLAGVHHDDFAKMTRCRAQAASMTRAECSAKRTLEREQRVRLAGEAVANGARPQPAEASAPPQPADPYAAPPHIQAAPPHIQAAPPHIQAAPPHIQAAAVAAPPAPAQRTVAPPRPAAPNPAPLPAHAAAAAAASPSPEAIAKAEAFAHQNIVAAARIRHEGGVTPHCQAYFRPMGLPTDPAVIDALVRGTSDVLTVLDEVDGEMLNAAD